MVAKLVFTRAIICSEPLNVPGVRGTLKKNPIKYENRKQKLTCADRINRTFPIILHFYADLEIHKVLSFKAIFKFLNMLVCLLFYTGPTV